MGLRRFNTAHAGHPAFAWLVNMLKKGFGGGSPELTITILGTDVRQVMKAHDMSFGLLIEGNGRSAVVDPGPDIEQQLWRYGSGAKAIGAVLLTHENHLVRAGMGLFERLGCEVVAYGENRKTLSPLMESGGRVPSFPVCGGMVKAIRVRHEAGEQSSAFLIEAGGCKVLLAPHVRSFGGMMEELSPDVLLLGVGQVDGSDPEYLGLKSLPAEMPTFLVAYGSDGWHSKAVDLPANVTPLMRGDRLALSDGAVKVLRETTEDLVLAKGWVSMSETDGKPTIHVAGDPSDALKAQLAALVGHDLRDKIEFSFGEPAPSGAVELFDLCLKGAAPQAVARPTADPQPDDA